MVALEAAGATPVDETNIQGTNNTRLALTGGAVDLYWEYTGTAWISFLKQTKPITDSQKQFDAVLKADTANGVTWLDRAPAHNTPALAETQATLDKYGVKALSDYAARAKKDPAAASMCLECEFQSRDDGFPWVKKAYGFALPGTSEHLLDTAVVFTELNKGGTCNFGEVFTADGRVASLKLAVVKDNKEFFPIYNPARDRRDGAAVRSKRSRQEVPGSGVAVQADRRQAHHGGTHRHEQRGQRGWEEASRGGRGMDAVRGVHQVARTSRRAGAGHVTATCDTPPRLPRH
jgi:hypothetical protein